MSTLFALSRDLAAPVGPESISGPVGDMPAQGLACYDGADALLIRDVHSAGLIEHFLQRYRRDCRLLLLRRSLPAADAELADSQPFARELEGRSHLFVFEGSLAGLDDGRKYPTSPYAPIGDTVAERAFCVLMARMRALWQDGKPLPEVRLAVVTDFAARMRPLGLANFLYCDSELLFVHGHHRADDTDLSGLFVSAGAGELRVASRPQRSGDWQPIEPGEVLMIRGAEILERVPPVILWSQIEDGL
ncbi:hypothetical protein GCM10011348_19780 [Marinobacterium nitratireducens]|uniref:Uncharacterized protein n=1 Tax=Marinobacterium nitratireducens TaxID=518897 RepID=A0A917ZEV0_9GAMM|nr:class II glutamine amidotransferase [Marinobacterium nitratireducens]GGO81232.1 hypothetical protein GCM10011348_19780 [Marinobacterium nitratireducens]